VEWQTSWFCSQHGVTLHTWQRYGQVTVLYNVRLRQK
jgi:hypothetical protein